MINLRCPAMKDTPIDYPNKFNYSQTKNKLLETCFTACKVWNEIPVSIRSTSYVSTFQRKLKQIFT